MTVIRPNSISGITSLTAQANEINFFRSDGTLAALQINGINFNNTSGISTLAALNVTGNVSIAGTLTYEDVTNVDSVGIITARTNIILGDSLKHLGDENTLISFPANDTITAHTSGAERLRIDSTGNVSIGNNATPDTLLHLQGDTPKLRVESTNTLEASLGTEEIGRIEFEGTKGSNRNVAASLRVRQDGTWSTVDDWFSPTAIEFYTQDQSGTEITEPRFTITSEGNIGIGTSAPENDIHLMTGSATMKLTSTASANSTRLILESEADTYGGVHFGDPSDEDVGRIRYYHGGSDPNHMQFSTAATERLRIGSNGLLTVTTTGQGSGIRLVDSSTSSGSPNLEIISKRSDANVNTAFSSNIFLGSNRTDQKVANNKFLGTVAFGGNHTDGTEGNISYAAAITARASGDFNSKSDMPTDLIFTTGTSGTDRDGESAGNSNVGTERMRISSTGAVTKPTQPCAVVYQCTGPAGGAANASSDNEEPLHFDHVHINQGGMTISQNNGRIEVPVTGIYFVSYMVSGTVTSVDANDGIELLLLVNGNEYPATNSGAEPVFNFGDVANQSEFFANNTLLVSLTGGDYVEVALDNIGSSPGADATINRGNFSIMLMA